MDRRLFSDAIRVYLLNLLHEAKSALAVHEQQDAEFWSSAARSALTRLVQDNARRIVDCITKCQLEDNCGIHPYFVATTLAAVDMAQQALLHSLTAVQHFGRPSFPSLVVLAKNSAMACKYSVRSIVEERLGSAAMGLLSAQAIARITAAGNRVLLNVPFHVEKALRSSKGILPAASSAKVNGWADVEDAWRQAMCLIRTAELVSIRAAQECGSDQTSVALIRAAEYKVREAELLTEVRGMDSATCADRVKLISAAASTFAEAAELCKTAKLSLSHDACTPEEVCVEGLAQRAKRLYFDANSLPQLVQDIADQTAGETAANVASCNCNHAQLASSLAELAEQHRSAKELTELYMYAVLAERSDEKDVRELEEKAREQRTKCSARKAFLTDTVGKLVQALQLYSARAAKLKTETAPCLVVTRECWEAAACHLTVAVDAAFLAGAGEDSPEKMLEMETQRAVADLYVRIATGALSLAQEYHMLSTRVVGSGEDSVTRLACWQEAATHATAAAKLRMAAACTALADQREYVLTTLIRNDLVRCDRADELEKVADAFADAARSAPLSPLGAAVGAWRHELHQVQRQLFAAKLMIAEAMAKRDRAELVTTKITTTAATEVRVLEKLRDALVKHPVEPALVASSAVALIMRCALWARKVTTTASILASAHQLYLWQMAVECSERAILCGEQGASTEALLNHHAAYHWAGAAEALEAGRVWDSGVLECAAKALRAAIDSNRDPAGKFEVMFALHCMIAQGLLQSARDVSDPFVASDVCSLEPPPAVSADDVAQYASDIVETTLSGVNCQHHAATSPRADLWEINVALARDLSSAKLREVQELSLRAQPDCTRPSSLAGEIARQELLLKYRIRHALAVEAGDGAEDSGAAGLWLQGIAVLNMPKVNVKRGDVKSCVQAWADAAEAVESDQPALAEANVVLAKEKLRCLGGASTSQSKEKDRRSPPRWK